MRIEQLQYIAAVIQHGSLRRASESLHVSQPALSESVSKLERELGVRLLDRRRGGAQISRQGQELLQYMVEVLESVDRLRAAAGDQALASSAVRIGTVNAANSTLLVPGLRAFRKKHPTTTLEVVSTRQAEIFQGLTEGTLDLGLVNVLPGDDVPPELHATELVRGHPVVCLRTDHPLTEQDTVTVAQLREQPFILMREGYLMHRFAHRIFQGSPPTMSYCTDGAEMGKIMVAEGLGVTVLPDYSVEGDPLTEAGLITHRALTGDHTTVTLLTLRRKVRTASLALRQLHRTLIDQTRGHHRQGSTSDRQRNCCTGPSGRVEETRIGL
jgi:DNA-binding transcriptional LysR family regulator